MTLELREIFCESKFRIEISISENNEVRQSNHEQYKISNALGSVHMLITFVYKLPSHIAFTP